MAKLKVTNSTHFLSSVSIITGIFGWILVLFILLTSFTPLSKYFYFGPTASDVLILLPALSWLTAIITGIIGIMQIKRSGTKKVTRFAKSGIVVSGIGCALFYGFLLAIVFGFYMIISQGYIGFILPSVSIRLGEVIDKDGYYNFPHAVIDREIPQ